MQIILDVQSPSELWSLLEYLRSLQTVKIFLPRKNGASKVSPVDPNVAENATSDKEPLHLIAQIEDGDLVLVPPHRKQNWDFNRFYGAANTGMKMEEIDTKLNQLRSEWERDTY